MCVAPSTINAVPNCSDIELSQESKPHHEAVEGCSEQSALARQHFTCMYLAHHEPESVLLDVVTVKSLVRTEIR